MISLVRDNNQLGISTAGLGKMPRSFCISNGGVRLGGYLVLEGIERQSDEATRFHRPSRRHSYDVAMRLARTGELVRALADAVSKRGATMPTFICSACGTQYPPSDAPPVQCPVCEDERQYIPSEGQSWTTLERLRISHHNGFRQCEPGLIGIGTSSSSGNAIASLVTVRKLLDAAAQNVGWYVGCQRQIGHGSASVITAARDLKLTRTLHPPKTALRESGRGAGQVKTFGSDLRDHGQAESKSSASDT
jgi:hypothetical protein